MCALQGYEVSEQLRKYLRQTCFSSPQITPFPHKFSRGAIIFAADGNWADLTFKMIGIDGHVRVLEEDPERGLPLQRIVRRYGKRTLGRKTWLPNVSRSHSKNRSTIGFTCSLRSG